jgi:uncharacterized protein VirK/YbjX
LSTSCRLSGTSDLDVVLLSEIYASPLLGGLWDVFVAEAGTYGLGPRLVRSVRRAQILRHPDAFRELATNKALLSHLKNDPVTDPLFYLSHRHYLLRDLTVRDRVRAALTHYRHEVTAFDDVYFASVYEKGGLVLWSSHQNGVTYDITLTPGQDVLYEGGLTVAFRVDGQRVCVLSYAVLEAELIVPGHTSKSAILVSRNHLSQSRDYQAAFNRHFHRCMPGHLCMGAISGIARALGHHSVFGLLPGQHPSWSPEREAQFKITYNDFWESLSGTKASEKCYEIQVPFPHKAVAEMDAAHRKRCLQRRAHVDDVHDAAHGVILDRLRPPGAVAPGRRIAASATYA